MSARKRKDGNGRINASSVMVYPDVKKKLNKFVKDGEFACVSDAIGSLLKRNGV